MRATRCGPASPTSRVIRTKASWSSSTTSSTRTTGTIHARGLFKNADRRFTPGMFARVKLIGSGKYDALLINDSAIGTDQSVKFVLRVGADNKIEYTPVKLGPLVDGLRVVRDGLKQNDVIVVKGLQQVRPGMPVTPQLVAMG